jgi:signal transduction histidine kinase
VLATIEALRAPAAILVASGLVVAANRAWRAAAADEAATFCPVGEVYPDWAATTGAFADASFTAALALVLAGASRELSRSVRAGERDGEIQVCVRRIEGQSPARFLVVHERLAAPREADAEDRVLKAQIEERERLAADLHDSVGQNLVCIGLGLARLNRQAEAGSEAAAVVADISASVQEAHTAIRTLSFLLQPPWVEGPGGFETAIGELASGFARRAGLQAKVVVSPVPRLCRGRQLTLFRVLQEALVNVHRHAHADAVEVELAARGRGVVLSVRDNGEGVAAPEGVTPSPGVGLLSMRARLRRFGGDLGFVSGSGGTTLTAKLAI